MIGKTHLIGLILLQLCAVSPLYSQICDCASTGNCPVPIVDNGSFDGTLDVTTLGSNDLATNPLTSVCFSITHTWIGDLYVSLTSPSGVNYLLMADINNNYGGCGQQQDNLDVCIVLGDHKPLTNNTDYQCNAGPCTSGLCCLTGDWTVACNVTAPINNIPVAPNCDLNDFNVPGQPVNGTWTLTVTDVCNMDTGVLNNFSLEFADPVSCIVCEAEGGTLDTLAITTCTGDPELELNLPIDSTADVSEYGYTFIIVENDTILGFDTIPDLTGLPAGTYQVYGFSYLLFDTSDLNSIIGMNIDSVDADLISTIAPFCGDISDNNIPVTILPQIPPTIIDTAVCQGDCILVGGQSVCASNTLTLQSWRGCDSVVQVTLTPILPDTVHLALTVCEGACTIVGGQSYCAPGPHFVSLSTWQGCDSVVHVTFTELVVNANINPANPPALTCTNASVTLNGSASTPAGVLFNWSGPGGFTSTNSSISVGTAGTYTLTVTDNTISPACTDVASVTVSSNVVPPDLTVNGPAPQICNGSSFDLATLSVVDANNTNPSITFHSATPATPANQLGSTIVSPSANTTYYILATNGTCTDETSVILTVVNVPTANFSAEASICQTTTATVNYTGNASPGAAYNWDFDGGTVVSGTGQGPFEISWTTAGTYTITLSVSSNGCTSSNFTQNVTVENPLEAPVISCTTTTSSIEFSWNNVAGANSYTVNLLSGPAGTQAGNTYLVTGLNPGDQVQIEVVAIGPAICGNSSAQLTCTAENCPGVTIDIAPVADICRTTSSLPFNLSATVSGAGTGTLTWLGTGITNASTGTFDPQQAAIGLNTITAQYQEGNCNYTATIQINVYQTPSASFAATSPICLSNSSTVTFNGTAAPGAVFNWDFDGGNALPGTGQGPHQVSWNTGGTKTITLTVVSADGCSSQFFSAEVVVDAPLSAPVISCTTTTNSITFNWTAVPGADGYNITVQGQQLTVTNTSYEITGLSPGDMETITVEAFGASTCGPVSDSETCQAQDCPPVMVAINPAADICLTASSPTITLTATISNNGGNGTLTWSGPGTSVNGVFDPTQANMGANTITALYEEGTCVYTETIIINVFQTPASGFILPASACTGEAVSVSYSGVATPGMVFDWDFGGGVAVQQGGPGQYQVSWPAGGNYTVSLVVTSADGCASSLSENDIQIETPLQAPSLSCNSTTSTVQFSWPDVPGATGYEVTLLNGPVGVQGPNSYTVSGISAGAGESVTISLEVSGNGACPPVTVEASCTSLPCPGITVDVQPVADICLNQSTTTLQLAAAVTGGSNGTGQWSGPGITNATTGIFDPNMAGVGQHSIAYTYSEQGCSFTDNVVIHVYQTPTASFTADSQICIEDMANVSFTGSANSGASFTWDFGGGTAFPGSGPGPHQVSWPSGGAKLISLTVSEGACASQVFTQPVQVDEALATPNIFCSATTDSIAFFWADVAGALSYDVVVLNGPSGFATSDTSYVFGNLDPSQQVAIQVTATGNTSCPPTIVQQACNAQPCPGVTIDIVPVAPMCITNAEPVTLLVNVDGGSPGGISIWNGPGVANGVFDPALAGIGTHTITFSYQLANCPYSAQTDITIAPPPTADAGEDGSLSCWESESTFRLGGQTNSVGPNIIYTWSADWGTFPADPHALHPEVSEPGVYTLLVIDPDLGCFSTDEVVVVSTKGEPVFDYEITPITCQGRNDAAVTITAVDGGTGPYYFSLNGEPYVESLDFTFLSPGDYELSVIDAAGCEGQEHFSIAEGNVLTADLTANLVGKNFIYAGEPLQLITVSSFPENQLDSIYWTHAELLNCSDCLNPVATPWETTTFTVTLEVGGCVASDDITVYVDEEIPIYVPNAFSPNGDNINDLFTIYTGPQVLNIKNFMVFDRWGESVFKSENAAPGEPHTGWDGTHKGRLMNPAVFTWFAELEFANGTTRILEGDVTLMR